MVAKATGGGAPPTPTPPIDDLVISVDDEPRSSKDGDKKDKDKEKEKEKKKGGWVKAAKSKATGTLRRTLFGRSTKRRAKDAEDVIHEQDEADDGDDDFTQSNYDTVKSLPATGHYGRSRVGHLHVDSNGELQKLDDADDAGSESGGATGGGGVARRPAQPPVIIFKVPRRRASALPPRLSPNQFNIIRGPMSDPVFDYYTWHTSDENNHDAVYSLFMKAHKCYDLIPTSTKLVVFDTHLPVRKAFYALVYNGVRAAPLWDSDKQQFTGMLTITDFIKILIRHYEAGDTAERMRALEDQEINHWREQFEQDGSLRTLVAIDPNESLHRAVQVLCESKVHRLPVLDRRTGNITYILTHKRLIKFLSLYMHDLPRPTFMSCTPHELGIGSWGDVLCCHVDTPLHDALDLFLKNRVSALPLVDQDGRVVDIYAKFDVISLAAENSYDKLDCTVQEALSHRSEWFEGVHTCLESDSLFTVLETIVKAEVHRLIVTDKEKKVVGVISLSDILKYLVLDPVQEPPPQPSTQTQTQSTPMPRNVSGSTACSNDSPPSSIPEGVEIDDDDN